MRASRILAVLLVAWPLQLRAASIALYADAGCVTCDLRIPSGTTSAAFYVAVSGATSAPEYCEGVTLAEFRIVGLPAGWRVSLTPAPDATIVGSPFSTGVNVAFREPRPGDCVLLYTGWLTPPAAGAQAVLHVVAHAIPRDPSRACPVVRPGNCGSAFCVDGGSLHVDTPASCLTGVTPATWERVKQLFR